MTETTEIVVYLIGEAVTVRRPVYARRLHDNVYQIADQPYDRESERWEFEPGEQVTCELIDSEDGPVLTAVRRA